MALVDQIDIDQLRKRAKAVHLLSLLAIVYYFAGGKLGNEFSFLGSGISFTNPGVLEYFAFIYYCLIYYRYHLLVSEKRDDLVQRELTTAFQNHKTRNYISSRIEKNLENIKKEESILQDTPTQELVVRFPNNYPGKTNGKYFINLTITAGEPVQNSYGIVTNSVRTHFIFSSWESFIISWKIASKYLFGMDESLLLFYPKLAFLFSITILITDFVFQLIS